MVFRTAIIIVSTSIHYPSLQYRGLIVETCLPPGAGGLWPEAPQVQPPPQGPAAPPRQLEDCSRVHEQAGHQREGDRTSWWVLHYTIIKQL